VSGGGVVAPYSVRPTWPASARFARTAADTRPDDGPVIQNFLQYLTNRRTVPNLIIDWKSIAQRRHGPLARRGRAQAAHERAGYVLIGGGWCVLGDVACIVACLAGASAASATGVYSCRP
jgi:hypothetical protein